MALEGDRYGTMNSLRVMISTGKLLCIHGNALSTASGRQNHSLKSFPNHLFAIWRGTGSRAIAYKSRLGTSKIRRIRLWHGGKQHDWICAETSGVWALP